MVRGAFDTLGLEMTKDRKRIKRAYSALVKEYHPEEHPDEWEIIHKAYQAAMEYAQGHEDFTEYEDFAEAEDTVEEEESAEEILPEDDYKKMFEDAHEKWKGEKSEKALALAKRLDELIQTPVFMAGKEWQRFFAMEFLPGAETDELLMLFEAISGNDIPLAAADLIMKTMKNRKEYYQASMEFHKAALADSIVNCICQKYPKVEVPVRPRKKRKGMKGILKELLIGAGVGVVLLIVLTLVLAGGGAQKAEVKEMAVRQLNEKYGEGLYSEEDLEIEEDVRHESGGAQLTFYKVSEKETYDLIAYMLSREEDTESLLCFDKLQTFDIRQALEKDVNERTGRPEGKLYWDSAGGDSGCIRDGYFHEKYEGSISEFLKLEAKVRGTMAGIDYAASGTVSAKNGNVDYYVPDKEVKTIEQRLALEEVTEDKEFLTVLEQCSADYEIELRGITLPSMLFEEKMKKADWSENGISVRENIIFTAMYPALPFSMMTGWYVCVPPDEQKFLKTENGMYSVKLIDMAEGILGSKTRIDNKEGMMDELGLPDLPDGSEFPGMYKEVDMTGCMKETETPRLSEIHKSVRQAAVSFCLKDGYEMEQDYCLVIDKELYNLPDSGYQAVLTKYDGGQEETEELQAVSYSDPRAYVEYGDVLDGEGYIFVEYPRTRGEGKKPVLTILY